LIDPPTSAFMVSVASTVGEASHRVAFAVNGRTEEHLAGARLAMMAARTNARRADGFGQGDREARCNRRRSRPRRGTVAAGGEEPVPGRGARFASEGGYTVLIEATWPKRRVLEVYLNIAEFGDGVYGVGAASRHFFGHAPSRLTRSESALLAAVLPNPKRFRVERPSTHVQRRAWWIERQMIAQDQSLARL
jgi:monofunctional biosynthetic peptidoglycan transglycosylase